ncbi:MAG: hypothetical protein HOL51_03545, partial [Gemmatimonadetes bacterium]|nr:hypothetical protein [Gemmatimonadota bacterium]
KIKVFANDNTKVGQVLLDKDPETSYTWAAIAPESFNRIIQETVTFDLGGQFLIRQIRLRPLSTKPEHFLERFNIGISEPGFNIARPPTFPTIAEIKENSEPEVSILLDPPVSTRFVQLQVVRATPKELGVADFEIFGGGFVSEASYESEIIELDDIASFGSLSWSGQQDPNARVDIRTRSGTDRQPEIFWELRPEQQDIVPFLLGGGDMSMTEYKIEYGKHFDILKPANPQDWISSDTENWSFWSSPYLFENSGIDIVSPGPRTFFQVKADFLSTVEDGGKIDFVEFKVSVPPTVRGLVGEIFPQLTQVGQPTHFTYYIRPTIRAGDIGFDGVEISTPAGVISVDSLRLDGINQDDFSWVEKEDGLGFELTFPRKLEPTDSGALLEVVFNAPVLRELGNVFVGKVFNSSKPNEVRQRINPGNAADEIESDMLTVKTSLIKSLVFAPRVGPNPFTPNNDNINDIVNLSYTLLRVTAPIPVSIEIFDLSGKLVKQVYSGDDPIGEYSHSWDGTNNSNRLVPPGIYLYRIAVDVQSEQEVHRGIISVVY